MDTANPEQTISREVPQSPATDSPSTQAYVSNNPTQPSAAAREQSEQPQTNNPRMSASVERGSGFLSAMLQRLATVAIALVAVLVSIVTWNLYVTAPWTRDGRIRVQVASVAPEVAGKITALRVVDNQFVHKGDILYQIDPFDFEVTLRTNKAVLEQRQADLHVKELQSERRQHLSDLATTPEEQQVYEGSSVQAKAAVDAAQQQVAEANINLQRTQVRSPVNGYVTNLLLREGDYAHTGVSNISIIDTDSFWMDGYFEETKLARICVGDRAEAKLMGYALPIVGHVTTVTRGVSVSDAAAGAQGLPNVDPVYTWVRLAQRIPVRFAIDDVPQGVPLVSGTTATITIRGVPEIESRTWYERARSFVMTSLSDAINGVSSRPGCIPVRT
ncbi:MAG TPA: HlyD family secretion protein [Steroidobacteraceae bacterium]|nr:HlyD family secretion protein [Steroidobacteraceae bacterium]